MLSDPHSLGLILAKPPEPPAGNPTRLAEALDELDGVRRSVTAAPTPLLSRLLESYAGALITHFEHAAETAAAAEARSHRREQLAETCNAVDRLLVASDVPLRAGDIADALRLDLDVAVRALRYLCESGRAERHERASAWWFRTTR